MSIARKVAYGKQEANQHYK